MSSYPPYMGYKRIESKVTTDHWGYQIVHTHKEVDLHDPKEVQEWIDATWPKAVFKCCYSEGEDRVMIGQGDIIAWSFQPVGKGYYVAILD